MGFIKFGIIDFIYVDVIYYDIIYQQWVIRFFIVIQVKWKWSFGLFVNDILENKKIKV